MRIYCKNIIAFDKIVLYTYILTEIIYLYALLALRVRTRKDKIKLPNDINVQHKYTMEFWTQNVNKGLNILAHEQRKKFSLVVLLSKALF